MSIRNQTPAAYPGSPLHLSVEFCANPPAYAARWLHGDRVYTPGNQYGIDVLAYGVIVSFMYSTLEVSGNKLFVHFVFSRSFLLFRSIQFNSIQIKSHFNDTANSVLAKSLGKFSRMY